MQHFLKLPLEFDVAPLLVQLAAAPDLWGQNRLRNLAQGGPHAEAPDIWVRYADVTKYGPDTYGRMADDPVHVWYPAWRRLPALRPIIFGLMAHVEGESIGGIWITKVPPGRQVYRHRDWGRHCDYHDKYYVTLQSHPAAGFFCDGDGHFEGITPTPGECWLFDNHKPHWVENHSNVDRLTLIVCIHTEKFDAWHGRARQEAA